MFQAKKRNKIQSKSSAFKITAYKFEGSLFLAALNCNLIYFVWHILILIVLKDF